MKRQVDEKADGFLKNLSDKVEELNFKLNKYKMTCFYCGARSTPEAIRHNSCERNVHGAEPLKVPTEKVPDESFHFNGKHFFSYEVTRNS